MSIDKKLNDGLPLGHYFSTCSLVTNYDRKNSPHSEWGYRKKTAANIFMRNTLGLFRRVTVLDMDQMVEAIQRSGLADSVEEAVNLAPKLRGHVCYGNGWLDIEQIDSVDGLAYRVKRI